MYNLIILFNIELMFFMAIKYHLTCDLNIGEDQKGRGNAYPVYSLIDRKTLGFPCLTVDARIYSLCTSRRVKNMHEKSLKHV